MGVHLTGVHLIGVYLIIVYLMGVRLRMAWSHFLFWRKVTLGPYYS
jgi:hypothetical protein